MTSGLKRVRRTPVKGQPAAGKPGTPRSLAPKRDRDTESRILDAAHAVLVRHGTAGA